MPCIVVTDLNLPGMNGIEATSWTRAHPAIKDLAVVIISSSTAPLEEKHARTAGAFRFLAQYPSSEVLRTPVARLPCGPV